MGFTRYFESNALMTPAEVKAGVRAVHDLARRQADFFTIRVENSKGILIDTRPETCLGVSTSICFMPKRRGGRYVLRPEYCKTYGRPIDARVKQLLEQLQNTVNGKLSLTADGPWDAVPWS